MKLLHLIGGIDQDTTAPIIRALDALRPEDNYAVLKITSGGGEVAFAQSVIASLCAAAVPVHTFAQGDVCSAAVDILAMGATRGVHPLCMGMTHASNTRTVDGKVAADMETARDKLMYATNQTVLDNWNWLFGKRKRWHRADDLVRYGFADYVADRPKP